MRIEAALAALVAILAILAAGCIETNPPPFVSARFHAAEAWEAALAWDADARLVRVGSVEARDAGGAFEGADGREAAMLRRDDPRPGDGVTPGWFYEFQSSDPARSSLIALFARGGVSLSEPEEAPSPRPAIDAWPIDSNHASALAAADVADWTEHRGSLRLEVGHALLGDHDSGRAFWLWLADDHATDWSASRVVDAVSGEIVSR